MSESPKYYRDAQGFCYAAAPALAALSHLTPWNGAVDAHGYALDMEELLADPQPPLGIQPEPTPAPRARKKRARAAE